MVTARPRFSICSLLAVAVFVGQINARKVDTEPDEEFDIASAGLLAPNYRDKDYMKPLTTAQDEEDQIPNATKQFFKDMVGKEGVKKRKSGLMYKVLKKGSGWYHPFNYTICVSHYIGTTVRATPNAPDIPTSEWDTFDSSYDRGAPYEFKPGRMISGWTEALMLMVAGDKWELYIPSKLGYGQLGFVPGGEVYGGEDNMNGTKVKGGDGLVFRMELLEVRGRPFEKRRASCCHCKVKTRDHCELEEIEMIEEYENRPIGEIQQAANRLDREMDEVLKQPVRDEKFRKWKMLTNLIKMKNEQAEAAAKDTPGGEL